MPRQVTTSYPRDKVRILLLEGIHGSAAALFRAHGYTGVETIRKSLTGDELLRKASGAHLIGIRSRTRLTTGYLEASQKLIAAGCFCIGTNQVDMKAASGRGVAVFNAPYSNTRSVAELVIAHCIYLLRRTFEKSVAARDGRWLKDSAGCHEVRGKVLGIVGYGHIGSQVSILAESMGMRVIYHDVIPRLPLGNATAARTVDELCRKSDLVTLHVPATRTTKNMVNAKFLARMKKGSSVINLSRGDVVDLEALRRSVEKGHTGGAALDVFPEEPAVTGDAFSTPVHGLPNVILTPHIGGSTMEAQRQIGIDVATQMVSYLETGDSTGARSIPELSLPVQRHAHRLLHIHRNVPGVLGDINGVLSRMKVNILGQYLKTRDEIGYVVFDIDRKSPPGLMDKLKKLKHTIRLRNLY